MNRLMLILIFSLLAMLIFSLLASLSYAGGGPPLDYSDPVPPIAPIAFVEKSIINIPSKNDWAGWYAGGGIGPARTAFDHSGAVWGSLLFVDKSGSDTFATVNLRVGRNWQQNNFVYSVEGSFARLDNDVKFSQFKTTTIGPNETIGIGSQSRFKMGDAWNLMGRAGILIKPNILLYGTAGWASYRTQYNKKVTTVSTELFDNIPAVTTFNYELSSDTQRTVEPVFGLGLEYIIAPNKTVTIEYLRRNISEKYSDAQRYAVQEIYTEDGSVISETNSVSYDTATLSAASATLDYEAELDHIDSLSIGFNYHF